MARKLIYEVVLDSEAYTRQIKKVEAQTAGFAASLEKTGRKAQATQQAAIRGTGGKFGLLGNLAAGYTGGGPGVAGGLAAGAVLAGLKSSVLAASDLNEQISKTTTVFGDSSAAILEWSKTTTTAFGVSERDALKMASSFGALFAPVGLVGKQAADLSERLTQLGGDLASFYNTDVQSALDAIQSGLVGQVRPLRAYGVQLSAARVQQQALTDTGKKSASELTNLDKVMARIKIIFQDTAKPQGDFQRTQGHLAQQTKILTANIDDLSTQLGENLLPAVTDLIGPLNTMLGLMKKAHAGDIVGDILKQASGFGPVFGIADLFGGGGKKKPTTATAVPSPDTGFRDPASNIAKLAAPQMAAARAAAARAIEQRNQWFDAMIGRRELRAGLLTSATAQLAAYKAVGVILAKQIAAVHDVTRQLTLKDEALRNAATVAGLETQIAADLKQKQADAAQKLKDQIAAARQERQGWLDFAIERAAATKTLRDDRAAYRAKEAFLKGLIRQEGRTLDLVSELWRTRQQIKDLNKKNTGSADPLAGLFQVSSSQLANILSAGTGLGAAGRRRLGFNIAGAEIQPVHVHLNLDGREVASVVTKQQKRSGNRTASQTSGRRG
jgi:hypothetical protein